MMKKQEIKIYSSESIYKQGFFSVFKAMVKDLMSSRELIWRFFLRDFNAKYRQSLFGWGWIFLFPLVAVGTFLLLNKSGAIKIENINSPYVIWALLGISLWQIFSGGLSTATTSIVSSGSFVTKINFAREALVISSLGQVIVEFLVRMALLLIIYIIYGLLPSAWIIIFPILILPLVLLTLGLGFITSLINTVARDTQNFINIMMGFFLFFMPIMYTLPEKSLLYQINQFNPIFFLIAVPREIIISGNFTHINQFLISVLGALIVFLFGWFIFSRAQSKIAEVA